MLKKIYAIAKHLVNSLDCASRNLKFLKTITAIFI